MDTSGVTDVMVGAIPDVKPIGETNQEEQYRLGFGGAFVLFLFLIYIGYKIIQNRLKDDKKTEQE